jgi:hypothetical protein
MDQNRMGRKKQVCIAALISTLCSHEPLSLGGPARTQVFLTTAMDWAHTRWAKFRLYPYTTATPHVRACSTGNSERLCPPIRFRCPGATILAFAINLRAGCMLVHASQIPKTFPLLHSILRRVASFRAKRISCMFPSSTIVANSFVSA